MLSSLLSEHIRRVNILRRLAEGSTDFLLYQPGTINGLDLLEGFVYSGKLINLRIESRRSLRLDFWLQNFIGERWFIARGVEARSGDELLARQIQSGLRLGSDISLGCSLAQGQRLAANEEISIWGFAEERGAPKPRASLGGPASARWGGITGNLVEQEDLVNLLDGKISALELNEALMGVDAQAGQLEEAIALNAATLSALVQGEAIPIVSGSEPADPPEGLVWRELDPVSGLPVQDWPWIRKGFFWVSEVTEIMDVEFRDVTGNTTTPNGFFNPFLDFPYVYFESCSYTLTSFAGAGGDSWTIRFRYRVLAGSSYVEAIETFSNLPFQETQRRKVLIGNGYLNNFRQLSFEVIRVTGTGQLHARGRLVARAIRSPST